MPIPLTGVNPDFYEEQEFGSFVTFLFAFVLPETSPGGANGPHFREGHQTQPIFHLK